MQSRQKTSKLLVLFILVQLIFLAACNPTKGHTKKKKASSSKELIIDGYTFETTNLSAKIFLNGEAIPQAQTAEAWGNASNNHQPAWCYSEKKNQAGKHEVLYNFYALIDSRKLVQSSKLLSKEKMEAMLKVDFAADELKNIFKNEFTEERNFSGKFYDLQVINWWVPSEDLNEMERVQALCWSPNENRVYFSQLNRGNGFVVRCLKK